MQRNLPVVGFRPVYYLVAVGMIMTYGMYKVAKGNREQVYWPLLCYDARVISHH